MHTDSGRRGTAQRCATGLDRGEGADARCERGGESEAVERRDERVDPRCCSLLVGIWKNGSVSKARLHEMFDFSHRSLPRR